MLALKEVKLYSVFPQETKASIAERFILILKSKRYKNLTAHNTSNYMQALPEIVKTNDLSPHKGLGKCLV